MAVSRNSALSTFEVFRVEKKLKFFNLIIETKLE